MTRPIHFLAIFFLLITSPMSFAGDKKQPDEKKIVPDVVLFFDRGEVNPREQTMRFGLIVTTTRDPSTPSRYKQLTYHPRGLTNNTCIKIDGKEFLFGHPPTKWIDPEIRLGKDQTGKTRLGMSSKGRLEDAIEITQTAEIIKGPITGKLDTCLVTYELTNKSKKAHKVGLRFLLDTFIGRNDGTPFYIPGRSLLSEDVADMKGKDVPRFLHALESSRLQEPGIIAHLNLHTDTKSEQPNRVTLGAWPDKRMRANVGYAPLLSQLVMDQLFAQTSGYGLGAGKYATFTLAAGTDTFVLWKSADDGMTLWDVPVVSMRTLDDAAVVLYWSEKKLNPGETRRLGFRYGLGHFSAEEKGKLGMILQGNPKVGEDITIMAVIRNPKKGQTVTLKTEKSLKRITPNATLNVKMPPKDDTQITTLIWQVRVTEAGQLPVLLESSNGATHRDVLRVAEKKK